MHKFVAFLISKLRNPQVFRFFVSGAASTFLTFLLLYFFTDILKIWYLVSSVLAYTITILTNFLTQKFWAFRGKHSKGTPAQLFLFVAVHLLNLSLNTAGMYLLVEKLHLWYLLAQFLVACVLMVNSFALYKSVVFKQKE